MPGECLLGKSGSEAAEGRFGVGSGHPPTFVIPAKAGTQSARRLTPRWVPAFAGMTKWGDSQRRLSVVSGRPLSIGLQRISVNRMCPRRLGAENRESALWPRFSGRRVLDRQVGAEDEAPRHGLAVGVDEGFVTLLAEDIAQRHVVLLDHRAGAAEGAVADAAVGLDQDRHRRAARLAHRKG